MAPTPFPFKTFVDFTPRVDPFSDLPREWIDPYAREKHESQMEYYDSLNEQRQAAAEEEAIKRARTYEAQGILKDLDIEDPSSINMVASALAQSGMIKEAEDVLSLLEKEKPRYFQTSEAVLMTDPNDPTKVIKLYDTPKSPKSQKVTLNNFLNEDTGQVMLMSDLQAQTLVQGGANLRKVGSSYRTPDEKAKEDLALINMLKGESAPAKTETVPLVTEEDLKPQGPGPGDTVKKIRFK